MSKTTNADVRRNGRDRRDAGSYRAIRIMARQRDIARARAREIKARALAWNGESEPAGSACAVAARHVGVRPAAVRRFGPVVAAMPHPAPGNGRVETRTAVVADGASPSTTCRKWLPAAGASRVVAGVRITAMPVADAPEHPFYVLGLAD